MLGYLVRRLAMTIPTLLLVAITVFALVRLIPGDPVQVMLGDSADPAQVEPPLRHETIGIGPESCRIVPFTIVMRCTMELNRMQLTSPHMPTCTLGIYCCVGGVRMRSLTGSLLIFSSVLLHHD